MHISRDDIMRRWAAGTNPWFAASELWASSFGVWYAYNRWVLTAVYAPMFDAMLNPPRDNREPRRPE